MTGNLDELLELRPPGRAPAAAKAHKKKFVCLVIANFFSLLNCLAAAAALSLKSGEPFVVIIALAAITLLTALAFLFLLIALLRGERPWWAYHTVLLPVLIELALLTRFTPFVRDGLQWFLREAVPLVGYRPGYAFTHELNAAVFWVSAGLIALILAFWARRLLGGGSAQTPAGERELREEAAPPAAPEAAPAGGSSLAARIQAARRAGGTEEEIISALQKEGFSFSAVSEALLDAAGSPAAPPAPPVPAPVPAGAQKRASAGLPALKIAGAAVAFLAVGLLLKWGYREVVPHKGRLAGPGAGAYEQEPGQPAGPLSGSLLLYYSFEQDAEGLVSDQSGQGRHAKSRGASRVQDGPHGGAMYFFDDAYIESDDAGLPMGDAPRSVSYWFKLPSGRNLKTGCPHMLSYGLDAYNKFNSLGVDWRESRDSVVFSQHGACFVGAGKLAFDKWYHAVYSYGGRGRHRFYLNGRESSGHNELSSIDTQPAGRFRVGWPEGAATSLDFMIDELRIYGRAVTADEAQQLYKGTL